jgi:hypothetical protein
MSIRTRWRHYLLGPAAPTDFLYDVILSGILTLSSGPFTPYPVILSAADRFACEAVCGVEGSLAPRHLRPRHFRRQHSLTKPAAAQQQVP